MSFTLYTIGLKKSRTKMYVHLQKILCLLYQVKLSFVTSAP